MSLFSMGKLFRKTGEGAGVSDGVMKQYSVMPEPTKPGEIVEYTGESTSTYTNAYVYKTVQTGTTPSSATVSQTQGEGLESLSVDKTTFEELIDETGSYNFVATEGVTGIEWELDQALVDLSDYGISFTPADPEASVEYASEALGTVAVDTTTFATQVLSGGLYIFDCMVTEEGTKWYRGEDEIDLSDYGITIAGTAEDGNTIHIQYVTQAPHAGDIITVEYTAESPVYGWAQTNIQPGGSGGGAVDSVNGKTGAVVLDGEDIEATVGGTEDTISNHLNSLRTDLGDLADDVAEKTKKNVIALTGDSGTLTSAQIAQVQDDTAVLEIVCDGEVFRLSNKDSTLTYRTFMNINCEASENVSFKVIYVQLNSEAVNYGHWNVEEVSAGGGGTSYTAGTGIDITDDVISVTDPVITNKSPVSNSVLIGDSISSALAYSTYSVGIGYGVMTGGSGNNSVTAIGYFAGALNSGDNNSSSVSIGAYANARKQYSIQLGKGQNNEANTFSVGLSSSNNYKLLDSDGTIPTDRFTTTPTTDGTYNATITVADGVVTRSWATAGSGGGVSDVTVNGTSVVSGGVATITMPTIDDTSTTSTTATWSASKLNTMIGNIESLINAL